MNRLLTTIIVALGISSSGLYASPLVPLEQKDTLKIISYNAYWGMKSDKTDGKQKFIAWAKEQDADIIAWQEMNHFTRASLEKFAESYGHRYAVLLKEPKTPGDDEFFPTAITSKYPIVNVHKVVDNLWHGALFADVGNYHFVVTHMNPFWTSKRIDEMDLILDSIKYHSDPNGKWIIAGDLNSLSPLDKPGYNEVELANDLKEKEAKRPILKNLVDGKLDYRVQQNILSRGFIDVLKQKYPNTFVATAPTKIFYDQAKTPLRYDYIYVSPILKNDIVDVKVLKDAFTDQYSDHYPVQMILKNK
ncbi:endonuclease/exonuclease/phosphatase family protein [Serratia sp. NPDC078593]|uniref:endonuclease/exonuclease/phosphatase family protein n=1 Tax=unclassified Serratia (in: enterobacteria) TaxID=2647522 RepID=UPI0037CE1660